MDPFKVAFALTLTITLVIVLTWDFPTTKGNVRSAVFGAVAVFWIWVLSSVYVVAKLF